MYSNQKNSCIAIGKQEGHDESTNSINEIPSLRMSESSFSVVVYAQKAVSVYSLSQYYTKSRIKAEV